MATQPREGCRVVGSVAVLAELWEQRLIGRAEGLTRAGLIERERIMTRRITKAFGEE
jgi:hypothetical protein